jgi:arylsulfatase A-like enzyme
MLRRLALLAALLVASPIVLSAADAQPTEKPNILFIVADDLGWSDVGWHGGFSKTPNLDRWSGRDRARPALRAAGLHPTRTALMSGRYPGRFGLHALAPSNSGPPPGTVTPRASVGRLPHLSSGQGI